MALLSKRDILKRAIVASAHQLASACGARVLSNGGNVIDAAIATSAALCVVQNNSCGLGGDTFALIRLEGKVMEINGSGRAAEAATISFYEKRGHNKKFPKEGLFRALLFPDWFMPGANS